MFDYLDKDSLMQVLNGLIKIGVISSIDYAKGTARVSFEDDDEVVSYELQVLHTNTLQNKDYAMPDVGEDVICIFLPSGNEEGFILGSVYAGDTMPPENSGDFRTILFKDGTKISYNRATHELKATIEGTEITANRQDVSVTAPNSITATAKTATITASGAATIKAPMITLDGDVSITGTLQAVAINASGTVTAGGLATTGEVDAQKIKVSEFPGDITIGGALSVGGNVSSGGDVTAANDVSAGGKSLASHTHTDGAGLTTSAPK